MKELPFHSCQRKDRNESQNDDGHREKNRTADEARGIQGDFADFRSILPMFMGVLLGMAKHVLRHDNPGVNQNAYRDGDSTQGHDVG